MKIALISPKGPLYRHRGGIFKRSLRYAPLTLVHLAALVPEDVQAEVRVFDEGIEEMPETLDADLVGMTVITGSARRAYELAARYRAQGLPVVLGGPHVTLAPEDARPHADSLVVGYAEETWPQLLRDHAAGRLQPRYDQSPSLSLAGLPHPRRDLLPRRAYTTTNVFEASRGCIHDCDFCVVPAAWGRRPYRRPVDEVIAELRAVGARKALFIDLNLIADKTWARALFEAMIPLKLSWFGLATVLLERDEELLDLVARSGCSGLLIGLESISQQTLDGCRKGFNVADRYANLIDRLHAKGITLMGTFVFGLDGDGPDVFMETARFAVETAIDLPRFAIVTPFPGTALYGRLDAEGRILTRDWDLYDGQHVVFQPRGMGVRELAEGHEAAWRYTYRRRSILRRVAGSRLQLPLSLAANWGYRFYAHHLHTHYNCDWFIGQDRPAASRTA
ncbi:MAG: B12-binding domain-containing radical SAM protein [Alphaproteobacteria bacterium]|nr:B12-binding domain-containing radical SAM protein [Alphaproteobacteria bacterium]